MGALNLQHERQKLSPVVAKVDYIEKERTLKGQIKISHINISNVITISYFKCTYVTPVLLCINIILPHTVYTKSD